MKVKELIEKLQKYDGDLYVVFCEPNKYKITETYNIGDECIMRFNNKDWLTINIYKNTTYDLLSNFRENKQLTEEERQADREALQKAINNPGKIFNLSRGATVKTY